MNDKNQDRLQEGKTGTDEPLQALAHIDQRQRDIISDLANKTSDICNSAGVDTAGRVGAAVFEMLLQCHRANVQTQFHQEMQKKMQGQLGSSSLNAIGQSNPQSPGYPI